MAKNDDRSLGIDREVNPRIPLEILVTGDIEKVLIDTVREYIEGSNREWILSIFYHGLNGDSIRELVLDDFIAFLYGVRDYNERSDKNG